MIHLQASLICLHVGLLSKYVLVSATKSARDGTVTKDTNKINIRHGRQTGKIPYHTQGLENILPAC